MSSFTKLPRLISIPPDYELFEVPVDFEYHVGKEDSGEVVRIPKGFITDGASIPKFAWSIIGGPLGRYAAAAVVHDYLYHKKIYSRSKADAIFLEAMGVLKVPWWKRRTMWLAVRMAGWIPWGNRKPLIPIILLLFCLSSVSCATLTPEYDEQGRIISVESTGIQDSEIQQEKIEKGIIETKKEGIPVRTVEEVTTKTTIKRKAAFQLWPENLFNIYKD